jgi:hypothetical protein
MGYLEVPRRSVFIGNASHQDIMGARRRHKAQQQSASNFAASAKGLTSHHGKDWLTTRYRQVNAGRRNALLFVVASVWLGLALGRREAFETLEQLFLAHAVSRDVGIVRIHPGAGGAD